MSSRFFENQPRKICSHLSKAAFLSPRSSKIIATKEKERRKRKSEARKGGEEKKAIDALLVSIIATLEIVFGRKKLFDAKGPLGDNVSTIPLDVNFQKLTCRITRTLLHQTRMNQTLEGNTKH